MVKVREDQPLLPDGRIDVERWIAGLEHSVALKDRDAMVRACQMAEAHALKAAEDYPAWRNIGKSFSIGLEMADILAGLHLDQPALMAAVLYRCVRKNILPIDHVEQAFGSEVTQLIDGVQRMAAISQRRISEGPTPFNQQDTVRRMLVTMIDDVRVALIKIVERTAILRQSPSDSEEKQQRLACEVLDIYAPLAHRLGIGQIKWELEDLSFRYLHAADYKAIAQQLAEKRLNRTDYIEGVKNTLAELLHQQGIKTFDIDGRAKHIYSIWRKMQRKKIDFSQVYDVRAVRVLVPKVSDCYTVLGTVHSRWHHIPHEFDDYIANPKPNGYQSLHTAVLGPQNKVLEVQIRTFAMHDDAELGVCAHWRYKGTDLDARNSGYEQKIAWMRHVLEWQDEVGESSDFKTDLASDIAEDRIYVFTPDGHVIDLPHRATPIDFAYRVHTEIGHHCRGAKVNGRIVPLTYSLATGQQVEILTSSQGGPSRDWLTTSLGYVRTSRARSKIQAWFKQQDRDQNVQEGRVILEKEFHRLALEGLDLDRLAEAVNVASPDDMYAAIGAGDLRIGQVLSHAQHMFGDEGDDAQERLDKLLTRRHGSSKAVADQITVLGVGNLKTQMANCCHPLPGDQIAGYITHGRGITIHREDCPNILQLRRDDPNRVVQVEWGGRQTATYSVDIEIIAWDRPNLLKDFISVLSNEKVNVLGVNSRTHDDNMARFIIMLEVSGLEPLSRVCLRIQQLSNVTDVRRLSQGGKASGK